MRPLSARWLWLVVAGLLAAARVDAGVSGWELFWIGVGTVVALIVGVAVIAVVSAQDRRDG